MKISKILAVILFSVMAGGVSAATVHTGQTNLAYLLQSGAGISGIHVGANLTNVGASLGNSLTIGIDGTSHVGTRQFNTVRVQTANANINGIGVHGNLENTAASIGNSLSLVIDECGKCGTGSNVYVAQMNMTGINTAYASIGRGHVIGNVTQTAAAIGNSASITIVN